MSVRSADDDAVRQRLPEKRDGDANELITTRRVEAG